MTRDPGTDRLGPFRQGLRFAGVVLLAFACTWLACLLQDRYATPPAPPPSLPAAPEVLPSFDGWNLSEVRVVAERIVEDGLPVPLDATESYRIEKPEAGAGGYQGFFESPSPPQAVAAFYAQRLPQAGWRADRTFADALSERTGSLSLAFARGEARVLVNIYPAALGKQGADFRLSALNRPTSQEN